MIQYQMSILYMGDSQPHTELANDDTELLFKVLEKHMNLNSSVKWNSGEWNTSHDTIILSGENADYTVYKKFVINSRNIIGS